jgi:hypothetical protein
MKYIKTYEYNQPSIINDYVVIRKDSPFYQKSKSPIIYKISLWNSEEYYLRNIYNNALTVVKWKDVRYLNDKELKKLDLLLNINKYNL